jgi:PKD repeat protein
MKNILLKIVVILLGVFAFFDALAKCESSNEFLNLSDTVVFDISAASYSNVGGVFYIDIPISIRSNDLGINALDFWFQFNTSKMTYASTTALVPGLDPFTNFNVNNQVLSNTTSGPSLSFSTPLYTEIIMLRFALISACTEIVPSDFFSIFALVNGNLSSHLFVGSSGIPNFEVIQPQPYCSSDSIVFNYPLTILNGRDIIYYAWDFGNGQTSNLQSDTAVYELEGEYPVNLIITTEDGCEYSTQNFIPIFPTPVTQFSSVFDSPTNVVSFTNESTISSGSISFYEWNFGSGTSNLVNPDYTFPSPGWYDVTLIATSDLGCTSSITQLVSATDNVLELSSRNFNLFPNPTASVIQIESNFQARVRVVDASGRLLTQDFDLLPNRMATINISMLSDGLYFLECVENESVYRERFMVQH